MTPELRTQIVLARTGDYTRIMRTTLFAFAAIAAIIHLGPDTFSGTLAMLTIAVTAYGILAGGTAIEDVINLREDLDEQMSTTNYGAGVLARDIPKLKAISSILVGLIGLFALISILF